MTAIPEFACSNLTERDTTTRASTENRSSGDLGHLNIRVVDAEQHAVAGAVVFFESRAGDITWILGRAKTRDDGIADVAFSKRWVASSESWGSCEWFVRLGIPGADPEEISVDPTRSSAEIPRLTLPSVGSVAVRLVDAKGEPFRGEAYASHSIAFPGAIDVDRVEPPHDPMHRLVDGRVRFEHVPLNATFGATAWIDGQSTAGHATVAGPTRIGEEVEVTIAAPEPGAFISGRVLDADRAPVADASMPVWFVGDDPDVELGFDGLETDRNGRFRFELPHELPPTGSLRMDLRRPGGPHVAGDAAIVEIPRVAAGQVSELGDVALTASPLIASGVVVDENDHPVDRAALEFDYANHSKVESALGRVHIARTEADGRFEIRGPISPRRLRVNAYSDGSTFLEEPLEFAPPAEGLVLRLKRAGRVEGRVAIPDGLKPYHFDVFIRRLDDPSWDQRLNNRNVSPTSDGRFWRAGLPPGRYIIGVASDLTPYKDAAVRDVEVRAGETANDPRLQHLEIEKAQ